MAFSTVVAYLASLGMLRWQEPSWKRRLCLVLPVTTDLAMAGSLWRAMFSWQPGSEIIGGDLLVRMIGLAASFAHLGPNTFELRHGWSGLTAAGMALLFGLSAFVIYGAGSTPTTSASKAGRRTRRKN